MKTTITRVNVALTVIVQPLVDVAIHDSHGASIVGKRKVVLSLFSQSPAATSVKTINHRDAFGKVKTTITQVNVALTVIVQPLVDVAVHDSHGTTIAGKRKGKKDSVYLLTRVQVADEILFQAL